MKVFNTLFAVITLLVALMSATDAAAFTKRTEFVQMPDGVKLYTVGFFPVDTTLLPLPVILIRTPYGSDLDIDPNQKMAITLLTDFAGYIIVAQDLRGTNGSEGEFRMLLDDGWEDSRDGYQAVEWVASQSWCNGRVGMMGISAQAIAEYLAAAANPPHLVCGIAINGSWNLYDNCVYPGGEYREFDVDGFVSPFASGTKMKQVVRDNPSYNPMWVKVDPSSRANMMDVPILHIGGWFDFFSPAQLQAYSDMQYKGADGAAGRQKLIIGPWTHTGIGTRDIGEIQFPANSVFDYKQPLLHWFNYWLKDSVNNLVTTMPDAKLYLMGPTDTTGYWNNWLDYNEWPFNKLDTLRLYPGDNESMDIKPTAGVSSKSFIYDPLSPVGTHGGNNLFLLPAGPVDQSYMWTRSDVLKFITPGYDKEFDIFGHISLKLVASSDRFDTDFSAWLVDIYPDGRKMLISDGIIMARHRNGNDKEDFMSPGQIYEFNINMNSTAYTIVPGHRLGLAVSSSNYPKFSVNPNTNSPVHKSGDTLTANNLVYFGGSNGSALILTIRKNGFVSVEGTQTGGYTSTTGTITTRDGRLELKAGIGGDCEASIYDINGDRLQAGRFETDNGQIGMDFNFPSGVYLLVLKSGLSVKSYKVLHIRE